jgi:hypothetical protein
MILTDFLVAIKQTKRSEHDEPIMQGETRHKYQACSSQLENSTNFISTMRLLTFIAAFVALAVSASAQDNSTNSTAKIVNDVIVLIGDVSCNLGCPSDWNLKLIGCCRFSPRSNYMIDIATSGWCQ